MAQDQELNLELDLTPYDPWVIKKMLSDIDVSQQGKLNLPRQDFENFIIPEMVGDLIQNLGNGVKVKVLVYEEEYILYAYAEWPALVKANGFQTNNLIGLCWVNSSRRFYLQRIN
ncbi:hypothetical protein EUTSA_v10005614mg [Eutrema salsugineum]|uniref:TF-B3 domain-containing protein n=1 Tax=Eutrema salsugineum TaxID=72664 RepID=V4KRP7_EUTSA|nr:hypothetical protein EUTSA_v10005614mg [Eutrema salsugineum]